MEDLLNRIFSESLSIFLNEELENILDDVAERNLCSRLSIYLTNKIDEYELNGYYADAEYNRKQGGRVKTILNDNMEVIIIQSDLIVHSRGRNLEQDNLLAIEMKKSSRPENEKIADRNRLRAMTKKSYDNIWSYDGKTHPEHVCGYILGIYIILNVTARTFTLEFYRDGEQFRSESLAF